MTPKQQVTRYAQAERIRVDGRGGAVLLAAKDTDWFYVADDWDQALAALVAARDAHIYNGALLPWRAGAR